MEDSTKARVLKEFSEQILAASDSLFQSLFPHFYHEGEPIVTRVEFGQFLAERSKAVAKRLHDADRDQQMRFDAADDLHDQTIEDMIDDGLYDG